jgi:hypothetical protein
MRVDDTEYYANDNELQKNKGYPTQLYGDSVVSW